MGTWGEDPFDNDDVADWVDELAETPRGEWPGMLRDALTAAVEEDGYLEAPEGSIAVAAAAVGAATLPGGPPLGDDVELSGKDVARLRLDRDVIVLARQALRRVAGEDSELLELWQESDDVDALREQIEPIDRALASAAPDAPGH